jgi:hypothetical protein
MRPLTRRCRFIAKRNHLYIDRILRDLEPKTLQLGEQLGVLNLSLDLTTSLVDSLGELLVESERKEDK